MSRKLLSLNEAGAYMGGVSPRTIRRRIADGSLTGYRLGPRLLMVDAAELDALLTRVGGDDK